MPATGISIKNFTVLSLAKSILFTEVSTNGTALLFAFGYDPLKCECGTTMLFLELYFNRKRVSLEEMYEKVMSRSRGKRSSS